MVVFSSLWSRVGQALFITLIIGLSCLLKDRILVSTRGLNSHPNGSSLLRNVTRRKYPECGEFSSRFSQRGNGLLVTSLPSLTYPSSRAYTFGPTLALFSSTFILYCFKMERRSQNFSRDWSGIIESRTISSCLYVSRVWITLRFCSTFAFTLPLLGGTTRWWLWIVWRRRMLSKQKPWSNDCWTFFDGILSHAACSVSASVVRWNRTHP